MWNARDLKNDWLKNQMEETSVVYMYNVKHS